ncbi:hypothetical protein [Lentzea sp. NBRC 105346]|uniref:hypothetical protein n=1 Tax=Lentzea sp. NBRC 105346 TaxID=3032205 RepID=UPI002555481F|nr:hypothetical protein [Lentzea sp. NBRC 105346]
MARWLIAGGLAGVALCVPLALLFDDVGEIVVMVCAGLCGLVFAGGVALLAGRGWWMLGPALAVGVFAPLAITMEAHEVVLSGYGRIETCAVTDAVESSSDTPRRSYHIVEYVIACPSGPVELLLDHSYRLKSNTVAFYQLPPLRPLLVRDARYEPELLWGSVAAMAVIVMIAAAVRPQPSSV